jgi:hypothetical protein
MADTTSSLLTRAIRDFLGRTDHVMNEWKHLGKDGPGGVQRSRSSTRSYVPPRYSSSESPSSGGAGGVNEFVVVNGPFSRVPSFQSVRSTADTDFGSCQDLNDYDEVSTFIFPPIRPFHFFVGCCCCLFVRPCCFSGCLKIESFDTLGWWSLIPPVGRPSAAVRFTISAGCFSMIGLTLR